MAVINVSISYLEEKTGIKKEEMCRVLGELGFPNEFDEKTFSVEVTPNRPDCYLVGGIIRVLNSYLGKNKDKYVCEKSEYVIKTEKNIKKIRPHISACVVKNIKLTEEEIQMFIDAQEKMHDTFGRKRKKLAIGVHNLDVVGFPLIYGCVKEFQFVPLDFKEKMPIGQILLKHPKGLEYGHLVLKGKYPLIYEEIENKVVSFPPIINEERTKLKEGVKNIFIEVTGTHKESVESAVNIICCSMKDLGGEIYSVKIDNNTHPKLEYRKEKIKRNKINRILGKKLTEKQIKESLEKMGYIIKNDEILMPPFRADIISYIDIIEDVAIGFGYNNFAPRVPDFYSGGKYGLESIRREKLCEIMSGLGFIEVVNPILVESGEADVAIKITNPCTCDVGFIRNNIFNSILKNLTENKMKGIPQKIYEVGIVYSGGQQKKKISFAVMDKEIDFNDIKSVVQSILFEMNLEKEIRFENKIDSNRYKSNRAASIINNGDRIGEFGEISKKILSGLGIEFSVGFFEMEI